MRCECCELPTITLAEDRSAEVDWSGTLFGCTVCSWENRPADEDGNPVAEGAPEDRNDGVSLSDAQRHFAQYGWIYDPEHPPEWLRTRISPEERRLRQQLRDVYPSSTDLPDLSDRWLLVDSLEEALRAEVVARERRAEATWDFGNGESAT